MSATSVSTTAGAPGAQRHRFRHRHRDGALPVLPARSGADDRLRPGAVDRALRPDPDGVAVDPEAAGVLGVSRPSCWSRRCCAWRSTSRRRGSFSRTAAAGATAAGYIIAGFARLVMGGDFVIGIIVFLILVTINFLVITKGATRIAEVGARFTLDAIPGKQMAIDADLSAGLIDEKVAQLRRRELEEESAFFGSMDGASKFVRGDAIAGLIILAVNIFGGIVIGVTRHGMSLTSAVRRLHQAVRRRRPRLANSRAHHFARGRPAGRQGRHARLGGKGRVRPTRPLSERAVHGGVADVHSRRHPGPAAHSLRHARRPARLRRLRHPGARAQGAAGGGGGARAAGGAQPRRGAHLDQGAVEAGRDRALLFQGARGDAAVAARRDRQPRRQDAAQVRARIRLRRAGDRPHRRDQRAGEILSDKVARHGRGDAGIARPRRSRRRRRRPQALDAGRRNSRARLRHEGDLGAGIAGRRRAARGVPADRSDLGDADASLRNHPQQSRAPAVLSRHARPARSAGAGIQAPARRHLSLADFPFRLARGVQAAAGRARVDPQSQPHSGGHRRDRAAYPPA